MPRTPSVSTALFVLVCVLATPQPGRTDPIKDAQAIVAEAKAKAKAAKKPGTDSPETLDCSVNEEGNGSQDCAQLLDSAFKILAPIARVPDATHAHYPEFEGAWPFCKGGAISVSSGTSPAASIMCGTAKKVFTGHGIFSLARRCNSGGGQTTLEDALASVLAHELAHLYGEDSAVEYDLTQKHCLEDWLPKNKKKQVGIDLDAKLKAALKADAAERIKQNAAPISAEDRNTFIVLNVLNTCRTHDAQALADLWKPYEKRADMTGQEFMKEYNGAAGEAAYTCMLKGLKDWEWATTLNPDPKAISNHPEAAERIATSRKLRLAGMVKEACRRNSPNKLCEAAVALIQP